MDKDNIDKIFSKLSIQNQNPQRAKIKVSDLTSGVENSRKSLLGKFICVKDVQAKYYKVAMDKSWGTNKFKLTKLQTNFYQLFFEEESDLLKVLHDGPWCFDNILFIVKLWGPNLRCQSEEFNWTDFWIHLIGLPMYAHTEQVGKKIAQGLTHCSCMQIREAINSNQLLFRFRAKVNVSKPLPQLLYLDLEDDGFQLATDEPMKGLFQYERLPDFCYHCGICGHIAPNCPGKLSDEPNYSYEDWLRKITKTKLVNDYQMHHMDLQVVDPAPSFTKINKSV